MAGRWSDGRDPDPAATYCAPVGHPLGHTSAAYQALVRRHGITMSMSDVGKCYDNAPMESLWATLKTELTHHRTYDSIASLRRDLFEYIEIFYNRQRLHSELGYQTPATIEAAWSGYERLSIKS